MKLINKNVILSTGYKDGTFVFTDISGGKLQVGDGSGTQGNGFVSLTLFIGVANIPSSFGGKTITIISQHSLRSTPGLSGVIIPTTIEEIHIGAFRNNENIQFVNFTSPSSLKSIGNSVFRNIDEIETIILPSSIETVGSHAFAGCPKLKNFYYCGSSNLQSVSNCFLNSDLVSTIFVTSIYPYSTFASKTVNQISNFPSTNPISTTFDSFS